MLKNRIQAGILLAKKLLKYKSENTVVVALPSGGVPIGYCIAKELDLPLSLVFSQKIGHPNHKEHSIGVVGLSDYVITKPRGVSKSYITNEVRLIQQRLQQMKLKYQHKIKIQGLNKKTVLIVDDGMVNGNTLLYAIRLIQKSKPKEIVVAVPIASYAAIALLKEEVAELIVLIIPPFLSTVDEFYKKFEAISDEDVMLYLEKRNQQQVTTYNQTIYNTEPFLPRKSINIV
ncbi:phosphoribosyltransferase [Flavobacterium luteum]|uniref:Phosphoribosyltransferase n=1 Tax=Flavobacterium luteum TaxID=2026654 RepID=A0A7J5AJ51_9FLAO|nr:phosphoribosyltransferase family protein [Flavobacterium luteum]KAB1157606.1 phosphoribosyltransferase [Flavobacterium luteum]